MDLFGDALTNYFENNAADILWLHNNYGEKEEMPVDVFFRSKVEMTDMELYAHNYCRGKILDAGAGTGSHSLLLQTMGFNVTALEISQKACSIMRARGVKEVVNQDFFSYRNEKYDTILLLMNGIGLSGNLIGLDLLLDHCSELLTTKGRIIFDSSDISYLYEGTALPKDKYYGEISYCYEYKNRMGTWFNWLYVDVKTLRSVLVQKGFDLEILLRDEHDQYLGIICRK